MGAGLVCRAVPGFLRRLRPACTSSEWPAESGESRWRLQRSSVPAADGCARQQPTGPTRPHRRVSLREAGAVNKREIVIKAERSHHIWSVMPARPDDRTASLQRRHCALRSDPPCRFAIELRMEHATYTESTRSASAERAAGAERSHPVPLRQSRSVSPRALAGKESRFARSNCTDNAPLSRHIQPRGSESGSWRSRCPVARYSALASAGATGGSAGSPRPVTGTSLRSTKCTSMAAGASCMRSSR